MTDLAEGDGDFHHLAFGDREIADMLTAVDAVAGEDLVQFARDDVTPAPAPAPAGKRLVHDTGVFDHGEVGAERKLLEDTPDAALAGGADAVAACWIFGIGNRAFMRRQPAIDDVDDRRFARSVVAD